MVDVQVLMPKADPNMTEGRVIEWLKRAGDRVEAGDVLVNVETEKLEFPVESAVAGVLKIIVAQAGESVQVAMPIAVIQTDG